VPLSARSGSGLDDLRAALMQVQAARPPRPDLGRPRLPVDRVFSLAGFGTVVTGTLLDGSLAVGDEVALLPGELRARVRGLQTHKTRLERAVPGSRVAINLAGVEVGQAARGQVVVRPGAAVATTTMLDARLRHLPGASMDLKHNAQVKLFVGAAEVLGTVRLLDADALPPGASGWAQLMLAEPVAVVKGDRFILRRPSPGETIGGGMVVEVLPRRRHRRRDADVLARLETLARGTPGELLVQALAALGPVPLAEAARQAGLDAAGQRAALAELGASEGLLNLEGEALVAAPATWSRFEADLERVLAQYHRDFPLRPGMPREEVKSRLAQNLDAGQRGRWTKAFNGLMSLAAERGRIVVHGSLVRRAGHEVRFSTSQQAEISTLMDDFRRDPYNTPSAKDSAARLGDDVLAALVEQGGLKAVSPDVLFLPETYDEMVARVRAHLAAHGKVTVAEVRDLFGTSRKYVLAFLEHLDAKGITRRVGDERVLR
jgi:selenocysteine-specific elongation factor